MGQVDNFTIGFFSNLAGSGTNHGYGYAAVKLIGAWQRLQIPVWAWDPEASIRFSFVQPQWYCYKEGLSNIGYTPWESTALPPMWPFYMNYQTEIWTTSQACKEWFIDAGVTRPIRVLWHGIDRKDWPIKKRHIKDRIKFLMVGADSPRKGAQMATEAFKRAFPYEDHSLTLKGYPGFAVDDDRIHIIDEHLSQAQLTQLYLDHHCMIYLTQGEGFGLIPFQAAATGMPAFVTDWSGPKDYMRFCQPIRVARLVEPNYKPHIGLWAQPDMDDIIDKLRDFARSPDYYFDKHYRLAQQMDALFSWDKLAKKSLEWLRAA